MTVTRTFARSAAVLGAATALTVAGAGAAMAATTHEVDGNLLSVSFTKDTWYDGSLCFAVAVPTAGAASVISQVQGAATGDLGDLFDIIKGDTAVTALTTAEDGQGGGTGLISVAVGKNTVYAKLDPNVYTLISKCTLDEPVINPGVIVGDPMEAIMGSVEMGSSGDGLGTLSSVVNGDDSGLGGILSSAIGGGEEGDLLGTLSSATGDAE
ncbi:hypothetical protein ACWGLC_09100 [Dietzia sp. NPDC055877]